jgi:hypothetical protein
MALRLLLVEGPRTLMCCPFIDTCSMFRAIALETDKEYLVWAFCCGEHADCGRYKKIVAGESIPAGLMPTGEIATKEPAGGPS